MFSILKRASICTLSQVLVALLLTTGPAFSQPNLNGLISILTATPEGSWVRVNLNNFQDVWAPAELRPMNLKSNPDPSKIILAWSSFAWDTKRGDLILYGGGHANYSGNDVYRWRGTTQMWERASLPSEITLTSSGFHTSVDGVDAAPVSAHTYDNNIYLPVIDRFLALGGAAYNTGAPYERPLPGNGSALTGPYLWDPSKADGNKVGGTTGSHVQRVAPHPEIVGGNMWTNRDVHQGNVIGTPPFSHVNGMTAYAQENGKDVVYVGARPGQGTNLTLYRYTVNDINNVSLDSWEIVGFYWSGPTDQGSAAHDPVRKLFVRTGTLGQPIIYWDLDPARTDFTDKVATPIDLSGGFDFSRMRLGGIDYDPVMGAFMIWYGGPDVWLLTPPTPIAQTGWTLERASAPQGPAPTTSVETGVLGKFKYIPNLDAFMGLQDTVNGNVWLFKPFGWQPPGGTSNIPPSVSITSPASGATFAAGMTVEVTATASDTDGSVVGVDFYRDGLFVGSDSAAPYTVTLTGLAPGSYVLTAVATDNGGAANTSAPVSITVMAGAGGTVTLQDGLGGYAGTRDTYLSAWSVNQNNGNATTLFSGNAYVDLLRFAIFSTEGGPIPNGALITSAQLSWYKTGSYDHTYQARRMLVNWVEGEATWSRPRVGALWTTSGAGGAGQDYAAVADATAAVGFAPGWLAFDVTSGVQALSSGQPNYGWRLLGVSGNANEKRFASSEYATQSLRPKLVISYATGSNAAPAVSITSPLNGASFAAGTPVPVDATASDADGSVTKVEFYRDGALVGTDATAPYSVTLTGLAAGSYGLTAAATDNVGAVTTSAAISITVTNAPPTVSISSPANGASFAVGAPVIVNATASDVDGSVTRIDFYRDGAFLEADGTAPYSVTVTGLAAGGYVFTAVATDNVGATTTSAGVAVTVVAGGGATTLQEGLNGYAGTRDTYLSAWSVNQNNGTGTTLLSGAQYVDLLRFAIFSTEGGPIPNGALITSAQLSWYKTTSYNYTYEARRMLVDWVEGEATWSRARVGVTWAAAGANGLGQDYAAVADATAAVGFGPGWLTFDVTSAVQALSGGQPNYGWRLLGVSGNANEKRFASSEYGTPSLRPKLVVTYTP